MDKEFGKLTREQLIRLVGQLDQLLDIPSQVDQILRQTSKAKFDEVVDAKIGSYCELYELNLHQFLAIVLFGANRIDEVDALAATEDPQEAILALFRDQDVEDKPAHPLVGEAGAIALYYAVFQNIRSMATYGRSICSLIQDVRENKSTDSLFKAVRMDRSVLGCPSVLELIARAQMRDNKTFFKHLQSALSGKTNKQWASLNKLRYVFILLREMGVTGLSDAELEKLLVDDLKVYAPGSGNPRKNLRAQYTPSKKIPTI